MNVNNINTTTLIDRLPRRRQPVHKVPLAQATAYAEVIALIDGMAREDGTISQELHTLRCKVKTLQERILEENYS